MAFVGHQKQVGHTVENLEEILPVPKKGVLNVVVVCKKRRGMGKSRIELDGQVYGVHGGLFF